VWFGSFIKTQLNQDLCVCSQLYFSD
jgi:hypothetical protein